MIIGTVKEIKNLEFRVGLTPGSVKEYVSHGHEVYVEKGAGINSGFPDQEYVDAGATILKTADEVWKKVEMLIKVKEPLEPEFKFLREGLILYTYLHLAANEDLTYALLKAKTQSIAYETIEEDGTLPCLKPMSEVAGRLSAIQGAKFLEKPFGGSGILISGVPGVERAKATIVGAGVVGENALKMLVGMGADVTILDINLRKLTYLDDIYSNTIQTLYSSKENLELAIKRADLVIGAVLLPGAKAPKLIKRAYYKDMKPGSVIVDVAIDQGGSTEVSKPTYHDNPIYEVDGIIHYTVANMPGAVPMTSTKALTNATLPYGLMIADLGLDMALNRSRALKLGINVYNGEITCPGVAEAFNLPYLKL
ncbi:alanine dehydrogenase [Mariniplasma anaerobium]|uniref:Alanine dehydrogenase n=1 Tax=Mariniplasma anaerobium TaxID=2735436 RepID=A0A7U9TJ96_9MOLU|nr:alanine dehydrogenase [Mariniplasma anaerobium]BCR35844.1 alanine dehydrogenase [Mariniplasma anaerobium]